MAAMSPGSDLPDAGGRVRYTADAVIPCDGTGRVFRPGVVEVDGSTVVRVGGVADAGPERSDAGPGRSDADVGPDRWARGGWTERRLDGLLLPGLVNVHCHSPMTLFRGSGENLSLQHWLTEVLWPREARLTAEDAWWGMTLAAAELLCFGVTTTCEMYFFEDAVADAVLAAGSRAVLTPGLLQLPGTDGGVDWWERRLAELVDFHDRRHGEAGRIEVGFGPHAAYTVPMEVLVDTARAARDRDALFHIHVAETEHEVDTFTEAHGYSVPEALARAGVFDGRVLAAHSIWLSDDDIALYRDHDVAVAHCPQSNAKLASGVARLADLLHAGLRVGLGTDGPASNNDLDLWEEMRLAALLARLRAGDAGALPAATALELATCRGGDALGRPDLGRLAAGCPADMVLVDLDDPAFVPLLEDDHLIEHAVWAASSRLVTDVWVAGRQMVADGQCLTVDGTEARRQVEARARRLLAG